MVTRGDIEKLIGSVEVGGGSDSAVHESPGLHARHYSPRTPMVLTNDPPEGRVAFLWHHRDRPSAISIRMPANAAAYASRLYDVLHEIDSQGWDVIAVEPVPDGDEWAGVRDRLERAAH
jgi:L-threonylcarbamoyladenylate synthase